MLQIVLRLFSALERNADVEPATARGWILFALAHAVRWARIQVLWLWRRLFHPPRRYPIIRPYVNPRHPARIIARIVSPIVLALVCIVYGFMFGLTAPYLLVPFAAPILVLVLLAIWALPETHGAPVKSLETFFAAVLVSLLVWPNYLALSLPGLPWITALRLSIFPMVFLLLVSMSSSSAFRSDLSAAMKAPPGFSLCLFSFIVIQFVTIPFGQAPSGSLQAVINAQVAWTSMFLVAAWVGLRPGRADLYTKLFIFLSLPMAAIALCEGVTQQLLWLNNVPSFLKIDDTLAAKYMGAVTRGGLYRVKSIYASPLSFAETLALFTPFCIHFMVQKYKVSLRVLGMILIPTFFICIRLTDARLGILGMLVSFLAYFLLWAILQLGRNARSLMAAAVVYAYPAAFGAALMGVMFVHPIRVLVLGGGEQASSDDARQAQITMGIPKILAQPWGHGAGNAAETLGYAPFGMITIDNYYLSIALDYGILGFIAFYGAFLTAIAAAVWTILKSPAALDTREKTLIIPLAVSVTVFVVIRGVLSQEDNHSLGFALLGLLVAMIYRVRQTAKAQQDVLDAARAAEQPAPKSRLMPRPRELATRPRTAVPPA